MIKLVIQINKKYKNSYSIKKFTIIPIFFIVKHKLLLYMGD